MRLTARGYATAGLVVLAVALAWGFGDRALNAVAAPLLAALVVAAAVVWRSDPVTVEYQSIRAGHPSEARTLAFSVDGSGIAAVEWPLPPVLSGNPVDAVVSLPHQFERSVTLDRRGIYDLDPPVIRQRDPLGLVERQAQVEASAGLVVYPPTYSLADPSLSGLLADTAVPERQEFDRLREYVPGDPLRNVHWKASAKHDEFLVVEFEPSDSHGTVSIAGEAGPGQADEMAAAAATIALSTLDAGFSVDVSVPGGHRHSEQGTSREPLLRLLAGTGPGTVSAQAREEADVVVDAGMRGTTIYLPDSHRQFESLVGGLREGAAREEVTV